MKEQLNRENIEALSAYRFLRAKETLKEIPYLKQQGYYNTAVNRLYYACYYAAVALLIKHEINPGTHAGVKQIRAVFAASIKGAIAASGFFG